MAGSDHGDDHSPKPELHERSESSLSLNADDEDDFHDVDDAGTPTPGSPTLEPPKDEHDAAAEPARPEVTETADSTLATPHVVDPASSPAATAMSSSTSLPLRDPDLRVDPPEATADELVAFLRGQITDLTSQVTGLNAKLVKSYTARGELEDDLHEKEEREKELRRRVGELEADKERWTKEIEQGGWVEKDHIQGEMQRLMTKVVEETKSRETAVQGQRALETEVENLTSNLFAEANKMVAYERLARARAEEKTRSVEEAGTSMQALLAEVQVGLRDTVVKLEKRDAEVAELKRRLTALGEPVAEDPTDKEVDEGDAGGNIIFSNGEHLIPASPKLHAKDLSNAPIPSQFASPRLLASALPYHEFLNFINYLRQLRAATLSRPPESPAFPHPVLAARGLASDPPSAQALPPAQLLAPHLLLSTHLAQPFLKRCVEEDSDPALRLDLAPGLGFLSRRNVGTAIVDGTLLIEPLHAGSELPSDKCSLCGCSFAKWLAHSGMHRSKSAPGSGSNTTATNLNQTMRKVLGGGGWSISSTFSRSSSPAQAASPMSAPGSATRESFIFPDAPPHPSHHPLDPSLQVHVFRIKDTSTARYPVCPSYCLARLRAVCEFWTYVRVIERGLLLEEGFRFVQGRDGGGTPTGRGGLSRQASFDRSGSGHGTPLRENSTGPGLGVDGAEVQAKDFEAADTESEADKEHEKNEEPPKIVEPEPEVKEEKEQEAADSEKTDGDNDKEKKEGDDDKEKTEDKPAQSPTSPAFSRPQTPTLTQNANSSTGSLTKPGRPPRSSARNSPAIGVTPSPPASPRLASSPAAPSLPPRRAAAPPPPPPRHPATAAAPPPPTINEPAATSGPTVEGGDFVANAMGWEDRCWSEVVRLKESVFWARVAAVASDGSAVTSRGAKVWTQVAKIAVVYYSTYGHVLSLTETIAAAARETGAEVDIYRFPEILSDDVRAKLHAAPHANYPEITPDDLLKYDGFLFGGATRYGRMPAAVSSFFDMTGGLWAQGKLVGKMAGIYTSSASQHGGQETTALTTLPFFAHHGIIYVPIGFASSELTDLSEIVGGSAWGAAAIAGGDGSRAVSDKEAAVAKYQGSSFAKTVAQFVAGKAALEAKAAGASTTEEGAPVLAKAIPASAAEPTTTADADAAGYEVSDKAPAPVAKEEATPAPSAAAATPAESTPAPKEEAETAAPAPTPAPAPKKKSGGLFFCCGKKEHYDS